MFKLIDKSLKVRRFCYVALAVAALWALPGVLNAVVAVVGAFK